MHFTQNFMQYNLVRMKSVDVLVHAQSLNHNSLKNSSSIYIIQENKIVERCRDGMPKSMQTR